MDKNVLEQLLSSYNWWMGLSTIAVAIGILGEYVAHFIFEEEARRNRLQMIVSVLFGVLVLGGVVGEYLFGKKLSQVSEQLQQVADAEVAQFNREAAQARRDAETAKGDAAKANERAAKNETESAQLRKEAEAEHLARVRLQEQIQPRTISESDSKAMADELWKFAPSLKGKKIKISSEIGNAEALVFSIEIVDILNRARIDVDPDELGRVEWVGKVLMGVKVSGPPNDMEFIKLLAKELSTRSKSSAVWEWKPTYTEVKIEVGVKPIVGLPKKFGLP